MLITKSFQIRIQISTGFPGTQQPFLQLLTDVAFYRFLLISNTRFPGMYSNPRASSCGGVWAPLEVRALYCRQCQGRLCVHPLLVVGWWWTCRGEGCLKGCEWQQSVRWLQLTECCGWWHGWNVWQEAICPKE